MKNRLTEINSKFYQQCEVIMLPNRGQNFRNSKILTRSDMMIIGDNKKIDVSKYLGKYGYAGHHLYILSSEEIKEGDWYENNGVIFKADDVFDEGNNPNNSNPRVTDWNKKIILTTDLELQKDGIQAIDDEFLEWFVKNSSCESVEIRYTVDFNSKAVIIIPKEEPKQVTLEEVADNYLNSHDMLDNNSYNGFTSGAKWQQERMYSEEEVKEAFKQSRRTNIFEIGMPLVFDSFEDWFKQYKK